jgi:hypothetical protein
MAQFVIENSGSVQDTVEQVSAEEVKHQPYYFIFGINITNSLFGSHIQFSQLEVPMILYEKIAMHDDLS